MLPILAREAALQPFELLEELLLRFSALVAAASTHNAEQSCWLPLLPEGCGPRGILDPAQRLLKIFREQHVLEPRRGAR